MRTIDWLKVAVAGLVIVGFACVFGWAFVTTWLDSSSIAKLQTAANEAERDRKDAVRLYEKANADTAEAKDKKRVHDQELKALQELNDATNRAAQARAEAEIVRAVFADNINYLATALAGLVGTIVAMMFGQELGQEKVANPAATPVAHSAAAAKDLLTDLHGYRRVLGTIYAITYFLFAVVAIATWAFAPYSPEMIKNLATISLTLMFAIARSFFN
jgi:hypothetical protein